MEVSHKLVGDVAVISLKGTFDVGDAEYVRARIDEIVKAGCLRQVMVLRDVTHIDTTCLGLLVETYIRLTKREGGLRLLQTPVRIREVLLMTRLDRILRTFDTEEAALQSFQVSTAA